MGFGVDVDELDDPVGVGAGGGGEEVGGDVAGEGEVVVERREGEGGYIGTGGDEGLIFDEPGVPAGAGGVGGLNGAVAVGDWVGGVGDVGGGDGFGCAGLSRGWGDRLSVWLGLR